VHWSESFAAAPFLKAAAGLSEVSLGLPDGLDEAALAARESKPYALQFEASDPNDGASDGHKFAKVIGLQLLQLDDWFVADDSGPDDRQLHCGS